MKIPKKKRMTKEYADMYAASVKKWNDSSPEWKEQWYKNIGIGAQAFVIWWDTLKEIEQKYHIDVWDIAREMRYRSAAASGEALAKKYKKHGIKELYDGYMSMFDVSCDIEYFELSDEAMYLWVHTCPVKPLLLELGKTEEEIKEMAPFYCLADFALMNAFNPELENFAQPRLIMKGDSHCTYRTVNHGAKERKRK